MNYIKRKKPLRRIGKKGELWVREREKLKREYFERGIVSCEAKLTKCTGTYGMTFAHRYKRADPRCSHTFKGTILACVSCHMIMEKNKELTEALFLELRDLQLAD